MHTAKSIAGAIDHTLLKADATEKQILRLVAESVRWQFATVCINPRWVKSAARELAKRQREFISPIRKAAQSRRAVVVCACVGFPLGASTTAIKAAEAAQCVADGAMEIDMVVALGPLLMGDKVEVQRDIRAVVRAAKRENPLVKIKVILETAVLTPRQIALGCHAAWQAQAHYVKTSTGFHPAGGATLSSVALLKKHSHGLKVKAAGGIRDLATAQAMLAAGADRLGCSASVAIMREAAAL
ncbi:MAG: deoxyribose-phosphate aldolase [Phycisphaerales bacterium]|nr:deoxyribose-phosphate aldolase [Phycisphaerales bacterium]